MPETMVMEEKGGNLKFETGNWKGEICRESRDKRREMEKKYFFAGSSILCALAARFAIKQRRETGLPGAVPLFARFSLYCSGGNHLRMSGEDLIVV